MTTSIKPIPNFSVLKKKVEDLLHGKKNYRSENKYIEFECDNMDMFHVGFKLIFDYLGCLYILSKLQNDNLKISANDEHIHTSAELYCLEFDKYIKSISIGINLSNIYSGDKILVKSDKPSKYSFKPGNELKQCLSSMKESHLEFKLELQVFDPHEI